MITAAEIAAQNGMPVSWIEEVIREVGHPALDYRQSPDFKTLRVICWHPSEFLSRKKCSRTVAERVMRLNPRGVPEGSLPRGWHRKRTLRYNMAFEPDVIGPSEFRRRFGVWPPRRALVKIGGRRRVVTMQWIVQNVRT